MWMRQSDQTGGSHIYPPRSLSLNHGHHNKQVVLLPVQLSSTQPMSVLSPLSDVAGLLFYLLWQNLILETKIYIFICLWFSFTQYIHVTDKNNYKCIEWMFLRSKSSRLWICGEYYNPSFQSNPEVFFSAKN